MYNDIETVFFLLSCTEKDLNIFFMIISFCDNQNTVLHIFKWNKINQ